jgi:hypothetical protein
MWPPFVNADGRSFGQLPVLDGGCSPEAGAGEHLARGVGAKEPLGDTSGKHEALNRHKVLQKPLTSAAQNDRVARPTCNGILAVFLMPHHMPTSNFYPALRLTDNTKNAVYLRDSVSGRDINTPSTSPPPNGSLLVLLARQHNAVMCMCVRCTDPAPTHATLPSPVLMPHNKARTCCTCAPLDTVQTLLLRRIIRLHVLAPNY